MAHSHPSIGTTARANPVEGTSMLFPNGYDRNENRPTRSLVKVLDIADCDDKYCEDDYRYDDDDGPTENVKVTIKLSAYGIITETEEVERDDTDWPRRRNHSPYKYSAPEVDDGEVEGATGRSDLDPTDCSATNGSTSTLDDYTHNTDIRQQPETLIAENGEQAQSRKDNLYNEYECFVKRQTPSPAINEHSKDTALKSPVMPQSEEVIDLTQDSTSPAKERKIDSPVVKPKLKVVKPVVLKSFRSDSMSPASARSTPDKSPVLSDSNKNTLADRSKLFSPKTKTPIFIELCANDTDEGQDFMSYLQELKQTPKLENESSDKTHGASYSRPHSHNSNPIDHSVKRDTKLDRRNSDISYKGHNAAHKTTRRASIDVIVISDDEEDAANNSLLDFNFGCLKHKKNIQGGNGVVVDVDNIPSSEEEVEVVYHDAIDKLGNDTDKDDDETSEEEDDEEELDETKKRKSDDEDDDKDDGNEKGSGNDGSGQDNNNQVDDDFDNESFHTDEDEDPNDQSENEGYYSTGVRTRASIAIEPLSDFDNAELEDVNHEATVEDEEVSEILEVFQRQDSIDCHFETIESRGMDVDTDSDVSDFSGIKDIESEIIQQETSTTTSDAISFIKITPKPHEDFSSPTLKVNNLCELSSQVQDVLDISSDDEEFTSVSLMHMDSETVSLFSDCSSSLEVDNESDFESAIEEDFWSNTVHTDNDQKTDASESGSDIEDTEEYEFQNTSDNVDLLQLELPLSDEDDTSATETENDEEEIMEAKYSNEKPEKEILYDAHIVSKDVDDCMYDLDKTMQNSKSLETDMTCGERIRQIESSMRNVSYNIPFYMDEQKQELNPVVQKKLRFICKCRQNRMSKVLPKENADEFLVTKDNHMRYIENEIDWKKIESKLNENGKVGENECEPNSGIDRSFYIFGIGDQLILPRGPKLKKLTDVDIQPGRRSIYFRGVPGIINNASKMSCSYTFPKLVLPKDAASKRILHACNRLATQLSPDSPELKHGMMHEERQSEESDGSDSTLSSGLGELLLTAKDLLNSSKFEDAECAFLKLYKEIQEKPEDSACMLVETLTGLADICIRRGRMCRSNPLEWQWLCMHGIALLQYTVEFCESELEAHLDNQEIEWFTEQKQSAEIKCRPLEDAFLRALYNCLKQDENAFDPFQSFSIPTTPLSPARGTSQFPMSSNMPHYLLASGMRYSNNEPGPPGTQYGEIAVDWLAKFQHYCKDRLQSKDSRGVTAKILKSTGSKAEDAEETESILSNSSHGSLDWDNSDLHGIDEITVDGDEESPVSDYSMEYELVAGDSVNEGWEFFLHQRRNCNFESVVQVVSNFEKGDERESRKLAKETHDLYQHEKNEKSEKVKKKHSDPRDMVSPLHAHSISLTLARSFCRLADKLVLEEEYTKAEVVYEKILDIVDTIQDGTAGMLRFSARIMKNLGTVKSKQGKSSSGLVLLNKALNTYRDLQDEEANFEIAVALIELGNGYIVGKNHEDSVFDDVIIAICDFFEKDASDSHSVSNSSSGSGSQLSQMTSSLGSNKDEERNVEEAVMCYSEAISLLDHYEADDKQIDMFAKAVMRLGDCYFMQKDYDKALECYEKALGMFKTNNIFGKVSLMENAHVLCMLGVSSFMLHVYPRAASVFEMALHMVRCAYGFKRTFLNGMLQSLSGITYYKMKNYHKCVTMCYQGYETYCEIFGESMSRLDKQKFWLVCQTLYVMGNSYNILNLQHKAMKYLTIARSLMKSSKIRERRQFMRVLQILGDAYFAQYDYKTALTFYNEALEYGECESQVSFDEVFDPNCASDEMTIHNHLVSKSAEAHLSMKQYQNAVHYLEQAHDMQEVMGEDIKEDLINTLNQLGHMHSMAGDVNKAIESYKECIEVFSEIHKGKLGPEMCTTLGNLAAICYVKACISESPDEEHEMTNAADNYFQDAIKLDRNAEVCVKYGNFLYSQCDFASAITYLTDAVKVEHMASDIVYGGLEKVTLPELLQDEVDTQEEICLPSSSLARYMLILCHKATLDMDNATVHLICLMEEVDDYDIPLLHSLLGYALMELMLFEEAACSFLTAAESEEDYQLAYENYCVCLLVMVYRALKNGLENIVEYYSKLACQPRTLPIETFGYRIAK